MILKLSSYRQSKDSLNAVEFYFFYLLYEVREALYKSHIWMKEKTGLVNKMKVCLEQEENLEIILSNLSI